jgi:hypothetical protein
MNFRACEVFQQFLVILAEEGDEIICEKLGNLCHIVLQTQFEKNSDTALIGSFPHGKQTS